MGKPMMTDEEIEYIDNLLEELKPTNCLEWGSGNSTIYFPDRHESIKKWVSVESSLRWFRYVRARMGEKVTLLFKNVDEYLKVEGKYDFILVDGEIRNMCLYVARNMLNKNGIILLHDSERDIYEEGIELYPNKEMVLRGERLKEGERNGLTKLCV